MYTLAVDGIEKVPGVQNKLTADIFNCLGHFYMNEGNLIKAEKIYLRALRSYEKVQGVDHPSTLRTIK